MYDRLCDVGIWRLHDAADRVLRLCMVTEVAAAAPSPRRHRQVKWSRIEDKNLACGCDASRMGSSFLVTEDTLDKYAEK